MNFDFVETEACYAARMQRQQRQHCTQPESRVDQPPHPDPVRRPATQSGCIESKIDRAIIFQIEMSRPPVLLMSVINPVARQIGWASKREKLALKRLVLSRIGVLVKAQKLQRVQRRYIQIKNDVYGVQRKNVANPECAAPAPG